MKTVTYPITAENFSDAWGYTNNKLTEMKKKNVIKGFLKLFANITFFVSSTNVVTELLFKNGESFISQLGLPIGIQAAIYLVILFIPPIATSAMITLLIWLIYNPKIQKEETGNKQIDSKELFNMSKELNAGKNSKKGIYTFLGGIIFLLKISYCGFLFGMTYLKENNIIIFESMLDRAFIFLKPYLSLIIAGTIAVTLLVYGLYMVLDALLSLLLRPFYTTSVNPLLQSACETYYYLYNPDAKEVKDKEDFILQSSLEIDRKYSSKKHKEFTEEEMSFKKTATEIQERQRLEQIELSKKLAFKSPVSNMLKITAIMLPLIFVVLPIVKTINMDTMDFYNNFGVVYITPSTSEKELEEFNTLELLQNTEENITFISSIVEFNGLTSEQNELPLNIGKID